MATFVVTHEGGLLMRELFFRGESFMEKFENGEEEECEVVLYLMENME